MANNLEQHKKSDKIKWIFTGIAFVLVFVMLAGVFMQIFGKGKVKPSEWFKKQETEQTTSVENNVLISPLESNGIELCSMAVPVAKYASYGISPQSVKNVFDLSVTYTPANTTFKDTNFTVAFKDPNSTWASGKNIAEYATVSKTSETTATLSVIKAFSEQIIVTAKNARHSDVFTTFKVDYVCEDLNIALKYPTNGYLSVDDAICTLPASWRNGTIAPETANHVNVVFDLREGFVTHMQAAGFDVDRYYTYTVTSGDAGDLSAGSGIDTGVSFCQMVREVGNYDTLTSSQKEDYTNALNEYYAGSSDGDGVVSYGTIYDRYYNGIEYSSMGTIDNIEYWEDYEFSDFAHYFEIKANSMSVNNSQIIAG